MDLTLTDEIVELDEIELAEMYGFDGARSRICSDIGDNVRVIAKIHDVLDKAVYHELKVHFGKSQSLCDISELLERLFYTTALAKQEQRGKPYNSHLWPGITNSPIVRNTVIREEVQDQWFVGDGSPGSKK